MNAPPRDKCAGCGAVIMWCLRGDTLAERAAPLYPEPRGNGNFIIIGFTKPHVVPLIVHVRNVHELPEWDALPEWARRKRWIHHAPECAANKPKWKGLRKL